MWTCLLASGEFAVIEQDIFTVDVDGPNADAYDIDQLIHVFIGPVLITVFDNCLGFAKTHAFE